LHRREVLKLFALGPALPALSPDLLAAFRAVHASLGPPPASNVLSAHQDATVIAMAELILPRTDTPGAKDTRVNEFIDHILADWYSDQDRTRFLAGLADVDARTQTLFSRDFVDASPTQQAEILRQLGEELAEATATLANAPRGYRGETPIPENSFYLMFRDLALTGYFTSEAGFTLQLQEEIIPGRYDGCVPLSAFATTKGD
jgi:glucoside 3-dehydrogenase (cytochrome c) hitch-hiker subunit